MNGFFGRAGDFLGNLGDRIGTVTDRVREIGGGLSDEILDLADVIGGQGSPGSPGARQPPPARPPSQPAPEPQPQQNGSPSTGVVALGLIGGAIAWFAFMED